MNNMECNHIFSTGESSLIFPPSHRFYGVHPQKVKAYCQLCQEFVEITIEEYRKIMKEGECDWQEIEE